MFTIWPRIVCATRRCSPVPLQSGQVSGSVPGSPPAPSQRGQVTSVGKLDLLRDAEDRLGELDGQVVAQVGARHHPLTTARSRGRPAEEGVEDVAERAEATAEALEPARRRALHPGVAEHVVGAAALAVREDAVRLVELLEALLGAVAGVDVGMVALREATEGTLDLGVVRVARDAEDVVVVALHGHGVADSTNWHSGVSECQTSRGTCPPCRPVRHSEQAALLRTRFG